MKKLLLFCFLVCCAILTAKGVLTEYRFVRNISADKAPEFYTYITLDREFYRHLNNDYSNLLIFNAQNKFIPFAVRDLKEKRTFVQEKIKPGKITAFNVDRQANRAHLTLTLDKETTVNALRFDTDIMRFDKKISVAFYDKSGRITRKDSNLALYQYDRIFGAPLLRFGSIKCAKMDIIIDNFTESKEDQYISETVSTKDRTTTRSTRNIEFKFKKITPLELKNIENPSAPFQFEINLNEISRSNANGKTKIEIDSARVPLTEIIISADDKFYNRRAIIDFVDENGKTITSTYTTITQNIKSQKLSRLRAAKCIITIQNGDDAPLKNISLKFKTDRKILIFAPDGATDLKIYFGGNVPKKIYDLEKYADSVPFGKEEIFKAGKVEKSPFHVRQPISKIINTYSLWTAITAVGIILLITIIKLLKSPTQNTEFEDQ